MIVYDCIKIRPSKTTKIIYKRLVFNDENETFFFLLMNKFTKLFIFSNNYIPIANQDTFHFRIIDKYVKKSQKNSISQK